MNAPAAAARRRTVLHMSALTLVSRVTGFARVVVVAAVLGTSYLGNVYQTSNAIPNILFELFAAGALQSVLVPIMVDAVDRHRVGDAERTAGAVLGAMMVLLGGLVAAGLVAGPWLMRLLVAGVDDAAVREAQVALGTFLLWFFLPQVIFYAANMVATAVLNARGSFVLPVFAPTVNNVVVIATYLLFGVMRGDQAPSLDLTLAEKLVLALGTTAGVVAFCAVPVVGLWRSGFRLRPILDRHHPVLRRLAREGSWAAGFLALSQMLLVVVLWFSNGVAGGVVVYQLAFVLVTLPNALFAVPVFTTAFPTMTRTADGGQWDEFAGEVGRASRSIAFLTTVSAAALVVVAGPVAEVVARGNASAQRPQLALAIAAFAVGLPAFSGVLFLTRVSYAYRDVRTPTLANLVVFVVGAIGIAAAVVTLDDLHRVAAIGLGYSLGQMAGVVALAWTTRRQLAGRGSRVPNVVLPLLRTVAICTVSAALVRQGVVHFDASGTVESIAVLLVAAATLGAMILGLQWLTGGPSPSTTFRTLGADPGGGAT